MSWVERIGILVWLVACQIMNFFVLRHCSVLPVWRPVYSKVVVFVWYVDLSKKIGLQPNLIAKVGQTLGYKVFFEKCFVKQSLWSNTRNLKLILREMNKSGDECKVSKNCVL